MRLLKGRREGTRKEATSVGSSQSIPQSRKELSEGDSNSVASSKSSRSAKGLRKSLRRKRNRKSKSEQQQEQQVQLTQGMMDTDNSKNPTANTLGNDTSSNGSEQQDVTGTDSFSSLPQQEQLSFESQKFTTAAEMAILHHSYTNEEELEPSPPSLLSESKTQSFRPTIQAALSSRMVNDTRSEYSERKWQSLGEDPTIEESIECVFSHQLEDGEILFDMPLVEDGSGTEEESLEAYWKKGSQPQPAPSSLLSSFFRSEARPSIIDSTRGGKDLSLNDSLSDNEGGGVGEMKKIYNSAKLIHVSSVLDHSDHSIDIPDSKRQEQLNAKKQSWSEKQTKSSNKTIGGTTVKSETSPTLSLPSYWPQRPLLLRTTPRAGTRVKGIRFSSSKEYLSSGPQSWWKELHALWNPKEGSTTEMSQCKEISCIPINNGNEEEGKALVADFETALFVGTILVRIRNSKGTTPENVNPELGYFAEVNRHYQAVIRGRFRKEGIPMVECVTGNIFSHPITPPAPYVVRGALKVFNFFAPRLRAKFHGDQPLVLSPLGSTPQCISVDDFHGGESYLADASIEAKQQEPIEDSRRLMQLSRDVTSASNVVRAKARKREFDHLCSIDDETLTFDTNKVYTFEFLQHLVDFSEFEMSLGSVIGKYKLSNLLNGQPLTIMASHQTPFAQDERVKKDSTVIDGHVLDSIWSFELWHESLID